MSTPAKFESFFLVLALPFLAIAIWLFWRDGSEWMMSRDVSQWQTAEARVVSASVRQTRDRDLPAHSSHVTKISFEYKYEVDGEEYRGERFAFGHRKPADEIEKLERGETIPMYYAPSNPSEAVVDKAYRFGFWTAVRMLFAVSALFIGGLCLKKAFWLG